MNELAEYIRNVPDFPKKGIIFRDITTLLKDASALRKAVQLISQHYKDTAVDKIACVESRGFILGAALAVELKAGFVPIRKKGKLPAKVVTQQYALEYGTDEIEMHVDAIQPGDRVLLHDDLLATGGTMLAATRLVQNLQGRIVGISFLIELDFLSGRKLLCDYDIFSLVHYSAE
jgi:adenine phosphoribosyltransferase